MPRKNLKMELVSYMIMSCNPERNLKLKMMLKRSKKLRFKILCRKVTSAILKLEVTMIWLGEYLLLLSVRFLPSFSIAKTLADR